VGLVEDGSSKRERRRRAILEAARDKFLRYGYGGTSLADIVKSSGGSLTTLYGIFGSKAGLLRAIVEERCEQTAEAVRDADFGDQPIEVALAEIASNIVDMALSDESAFLMRLIVAECERFPELGPQFLESGPFAVKSKLATYLGRQAERGRLRLENPATAAAIFQHMAASDLHWYALLGAPMKPTPEQRRRHVELVVTAFLRAFAADPEQQRSGA
jgi:TetR/AcrR family transcriptional repressor of mexJK operon